ncbi:aldo/keto reductase, partial [Candidatus Bathyarchaeota archaeon]|nr:aldo/keto reductase [Candidatus Bathyarchaeota archaeon]
MEKRVLGRTGHSSTLVTLGGARARPETLEDSNRLIKLALDHGVNHIDVAPTYGDGKAEEILG